MATVRLDTLRTRIQTRADLATSNLLATAEFTTLINASYQELYDLIVAEGADYYLTTAALTITTGNSVALTSGYYKIRGLDYQCGGSGTGYIEVRRVPLAERNRVLQRSYSIVGATLYVWPPEQAPGTYLLWYVPQPTLLSADSDTIETYNGWEEYIVIDVAIKAMIKEESDASVLLAEKAAMRQRIIDSVARDHNEPHRVVDVGTYNARGWWF